MRQREATTERSGEQGFTLLGLVVAIFLILLFLSIAAPKVAHELRREREVEAVHRGDQYVRAIQLYYRKFGHYPGSIEQLEKTNNIRFLRQKYVDPMTGKADWRLIHVGEAKTTVKGFFGQPLAGIASPGLGSAAGMSSGIGGAGSVSGSGVGGSGSASGSAFGGSSSGLGGASSGLGGSSSGLGGSTLGSSGAGGTGTDSSGTGSGTGTGSGIGSGIGSQSATSFTGTGAPIMGVGLPGAGDSIVVVNEQTTYPTWEFLYDPRIEQLKAKATLFGGAPASGGAGLGSASGLGSGFGGTPSGSGTGSSFGTGSGSGFGSGTGSSPNSPASPTSPSSPTGGTGTTPQ